jgi:hypothetical protein
MRKSKVKIKRNLAIPGEPMLQEDFVALIKEAEKGPFKSMDNFTEDILSLFFFIIFNKTENNYLFMYKIKLNK